MFYFNFYFSLTGDILYFVGQTVGGNSGGRPCVFPFQYKNVQYISCILTDHHRKWCSTTANYDKDKTWGECECELIV